jgi:hypothetical protein
VLEDIGNSLLGQSSKLADRYAGPLTVARPHGSSHYALLGKGDREYKARKEELKRRRKRSVTPPSECYKGRSQNWRMRSPRSLPHINPTFANHRFQWIKSIRPHQRDPRDLAGSAQKRGEINILLSHPLLHLLFLTALPSSFAHRQPTRRTVIGSHL